MCRCAVVFVCGWMTEIIHQTSTSIDPIEESPMEVNQDSCMQSAHPLYPPHLNRYESIDISLWALRERTRPPHDPETLQQRPFALNSSIHNSSPSAFRPSRSREVIASSCSRPQPEVRFRPPPSLQPAVELIRIQQMGLSGICKWGSVGAYHPDKYVHHSVLPSVTDTHLLLFLYILAKKLRECF